MSTVDDPKNVAVALADVLEKRSSKPHGRKAPWLAKYAFKPTVRDESGAIVEQDERVNRSGRKPSAENVKSFAELRALAQALAHAPAVAYGDTLVDEEGEPVALVTHILMSMATNKFQYEKFLRIAFGEDAHRIEIRRRGFAALSDEERDVRLRALAQAVVVQLEAENVSVVDAVVSESGAPHDESGGAAQLDLRVSAPQRPQVPNIFLGEG